MSELLSKITKGQIALEQPAFDKEVDYTAKGRRTHYKYASLSACMDVVRKAFGPLGVVVWHEVRDMDGSLFAVTCISDGTETIERCPFPVKLDQSSQQNGSEFTYAKRYSLCAALGIVADDDDDGQIAQAGQKVNRGVVPKQKDEPLLAAKGRLKVAIVKYAELHGLNEKDLMGGIKKRPDYTENEKNPEWFHMVAEEFESES